MTAILILNAVLMVSIVAAVLSVLGWGIVTDRTRASWPARRAERRARLSASSAQPAARTAQPALRTAQPARRPYGRLPGYSA
jgi:hypothetical protein